MLPVPTRIDLNGHSTTSRLDGQLGRCLLLAANPQACAEAAAFLRTHSTRVYIDADGDLWHLTDRGPVDTTGLALKVVTPAGHCMLVADFVIECPPDWCRPYGLG